MDIIKYGCYYTNINLLLTTAIFGNKNRFVYGVKCEFCRKDFKVLSKILKFYLWRCKNRLQQNQHSVTESINVSNIIIETPNLSIANFKNTVEQTNDPF